mmetsp:Transcript_6625/g.18839  ORF Transcript_6625/g.18839 Transcript_6625/m.18839 type:complete len:135 (-) Transcript_6625:132-536(-)
MLSPPVVERVLSETDKLNCINRINRGGAMDNICIKSCQMYVKVVPRPSIHNACMRGCQSGSGASFARGCRNETMPSEAEACATMCKTFRGVLPAPRTQEICWEGCRKGRVASFESGKDMLDVVFSEPMPAGDEL